MSKKRTKPLPGRRHPTSMELIGERLASAQVAAAKAREHHDRVAAVAGPILSELGYRETQFIPARVATSLMLDDRKIDAHWITALVLARGQLSRANKTLQLVRDEYERFRSTSTAKPPWED